MNSLFELLCRSYRLARNNGVTHPVQLIDALLQQTLDRFRRLDSSLVNADQQGFDFVAQATHRRYARHSRPAFQRVQVSL